MSEAQKLFPGATPGHWDKPGSDAAVWVPDRPNPITVAPPKPGVSERAPANETVVEVMQRDSKIVEMNRTFSFVYREPAPARWGRYGAAEREKRMAAIHKAVEEVLAPFWDEQAALGLEFSEDMKKRHRELLATTGSLAVLARQRVYGAARVVRTPIETKRSAPPSGAAERPAREKR